MDFWNTHQGLEALQADISSRQSSKEDRVHELSEQNQAIADIIREEYAGNVPVGSLVEYQGSIFWAVGRRYVVIEHPSGYAGGDGYPGSLSLAFPDEPTRVILWNVRPKSVRVIEES